MNGLISGRHKLATSDVCNNIYDLKLITWNMQGANLEHLPTSPWTFVFDWFNEERIDIACLQEAGIVTPQGYITDHGIHSGIREYEYRDGTSTRPGLNLWIYHHLWDKNSRRVNLSIVSRLRASNRQLIQGSLEDSLRPLLGIEINNSWVFSIHASANRGNDAQYLLDLATSVIQDPMIIAGDYNREPETLDSNLIICPPNGNTHNARERPTKKLDYAVWNGGQQINGDVWGLGYTGGAAHSDHLPVYYKFPLQR